MASEAQAWVANRRSTVSGKTLYEELRYIKPYRDHRESLRPWDRKLPSTVVQEANKRALWITQPPSGYWLIFILVVCLVAVQIPAVVPLLANLEFIQGYWRDIELPSIVYHDARVLLAVSIVVHVSTAIALWFVYLSEGFAKHQLEIAPICLALLAECVWMDVAFYVGRLDYLLAIFCLIFASIAVAIVLLCKFEVVMSAVMLGPHVAGALAMIIYCVAFLQLHGVQMRRPVQAPVHPVSDYRALIGANGTV